MSQPGKPIKPEKGADEEKRPFSLSIARLGIRTSQDFANMMSALMSDLAEGKVTPNVANAICNAGGKLLKVVDMQQKYGTAVPGHRKLLSLAPDLGGAVTLPDAGEAA